MNVKNAVSSLVGSVRRYWKRPPAGRYMSYKEIFSLSVGGIGIKFITYCVANMVLAVGNTLIGNTIGIDPGPLYVIYLLSVLSSFPLTALRAKMIDNTRSMKGKYRPYILTMGIPTVLLGIGFIWIPYERMSLMVKCVVVLLFNIGFQFFYNFMCDSYDSLINVLSPNTLERSDVCSIKSVVENFSPSIASIFLPIAARLITGDNTLYDMRVYRVLYPPMLLVGLLISILIYVNTEEKIVQARTHVIQVKFSDAFRAIARNKYFWIISLAGWLGFLETSFNNIIGWMYNYQQACTPTQYSLITAIAGNASFWPNLIAPYFIRRFGKRSILVFTNLLNIVFIFLMLPIVRMTGSPHIIWLLLFCTFINSFISALGHLLNPSLNADIRDYQQYVTGERIDGMFAAVGLIGNVITLASSFVLPMLYERAGLNQSVALSLGYDGSNVYDVLYNTEYFVQVSSVLVLASVVGAILNVLPFFFYDLTETRQKAMVTVLKIRALFEDYGNGVLSDESLVEAIDIINEANAYVNQTPQPVDRDALRQAKKTKEKAAVKAARAELKQRRLANEKIEIAQFVIRELNRFDTPEGRQALEEARAMVAAGPDGFLTLSSMTRAEAKAMPKRTQQEKERRREALIRIDNIRVARKTIAKYYPEGIVPFDSSVFKQLFEAEDANEAALRNTLEAMKKAKEEKNAQELARLKGEVKARQAERVRLRAQIKKATDQNSIYTRAVKPYLDAKKLLLQSENYKRYEEIAAGYAQSKERANRRAEAESTQH